MDCSRLIWTNQGEFLAIPTIFNNSDGTVELDTDEQFTTKLTRQLEELTDINKMKTDGIIATSLPSTPKNDFLFKKFTLANIVDNDFIPFTVIVITGSKALKQQELVVNEFSNGRYEIELSNATDHWIVQLSKLNMNEVVLSDNKFLFDETTIMEHNTRGGYADLEEFAVRFPIVDYGRFIEKKLGIGTADLRPYISPLWFLQKAFCQVGWTFKSPWLESERGRRQIRYLLSENIGSAANLLELRKFKVHNSVPIPYVKDNDFRAIVFDTIDLDTNGDYSLITGYYGGTGIMDMLGTMNFSVTSDTFAKIIILDKLKRFYTAEVFARVCFTVETDSGFENYELTTSSKFFDVDLAKEFLSSGNSEYLFTLDILANDAQIDTNTEVYVTLHTNISIKAGLFGSSGDADDLFDGMQLLESYFWNNPKRLFIEDGDELPLESLINESSTVLDMLKGEVHLCFGKLYTDYVNNTVTLYPTYPVEFEDETVEGFFTQDTTDFSYKIQDKSEKIITPNKELLRYTHIKFNGVGDNAIQTLNLPKGRYWGDYKIDWGQHFKDDTEVLENPFYEATLNKYAPIGFAVDINIPTMWDNAPNNGVKNLSYNLGMRALHWHGNDTQVPTPTSPVFAKLYGNVVSVLPYAYQYSDAIFLGLGSLQSEINVVYGAPATTKKPEAGDEDHFNFFFKKWLYETKFNIGVELLVFLNNAEYFGYSLRKLYQFTSQGRTTYGRILSIRDFNVCNTISTPIAIRPIKYVSDECALIGDGSGLEIRTSDPCVGNLPQLVVDVADDCYSFSLGGTSYDVIDSVTFDWRYAGGSWTEDVIEVCDPTEDFEVRMIVVYENCPEITIRIKIEPCNNKPEVVITYNYEDKCVVITIEGQIVSEIDTITIEYSLDDGVTYLPYTPDDCVDVEDGTTVLVNATVTYTNACEDSEINGSLDVIPEIIDCEATTADVECGEDGVVRTGVIVGEYSHDDIQYRFEEDEIWKKWDEICPFVTAVYIRRVVTYCNSVCPNYCSIAKYCADYCTIDVNITYGTPSAGMIELTAVVDCIAPTFEWFKDGVSVGTTQVITVEMGFDYEVKVNCDGCKGSDEISIDNEAAWGGLI